MILSPYIQDYIDEVETGETPANEDIKALIKIIKNEFESGNIYVDETQAGKYLSYQKYFSYKLLKWEVFCFVLHNCTYYRPPHKFAGQLRWPMLLLYVGRGAGKNGYLAFEDFCLLTSTNGVKEYNIDIFAMSEKQAKASWADVYNVLEENEKKMKKHFSWTKEIIINLDTNSEFSYNTSSPKTKDGARPGKVDFDEIHAYQNKKLIDVGTTGLGKKRHPRRTFITTDEDDVRGGFLDDKKQDAEEVLHNGAPDNGWLYVMYHVESREEIDDPKSWPKANPSLPYFPHLEYEIQLEFADYKKDPIGNRSFASKRMNFPLGITETSITSWENIEATAEPIDEEELIGKPCVAGFDYMKTTDFLGAGLLFRVDDKDIWVTHTWVCSRSEDLIRIKAPLQQWESQGLLTFVDAPEIPADLPVSWVTNKAIELNADIRKIGIDMYRYQMMRNSLEAAGYVWDKKADMSQILLIRPSNEMQTAPIITSRFVNHAFVWGDNPLMRWAAWNSKMEISKAGNITYGKIEPKSRKTDPFKALVAAECVSDVLNEVDVNIDEYFDSKLTSNGVFTFD